jgi:hypothetical protein
MALQERGLTVLEGVAADIDTAEIDCALFAINPSAGIDGQTIADWEKFNDYLTPRIMVALALPGAELDFDDAVLLANRVFDQFVTPYLVLHADDGSPAALISLEDLTVRNYIAGLPIITASEPEHRELVSDFAREYKEALSDSGEDAFSAGMLFPAIPINIESGIGLDVLISYIDQLR